MVLYDITFQQTVIFVSLQFNNSARKTGGTRSLLKRIEAEASGQFDIPASLPPGKGPPYPFKKEGRVKTQEPVRSLRTTETSVPPA